MAIGKVRPYVHGKYYFPISKQELNVLRTHHREQLMEILSKYDGNISSPGGGTAQIVFPDREKALRAQGRIEDLLGIEEDVTAFTPKWIQMSASSQGGYAVLRMRKTDLRELLSMTESKQRDTKFGALIKEFEK